MTIFINIMVSEIVSRMNIKSTILVLLLLLLANTARAQRIDPATMSVSGGVMETSSLSVSWTVGQTATQSHAWRGGLLSEGFQQPFLTVIPIREQSIPLSLSLYPNPVRYSLLVSMTGVDQDISLVLYNLLGMPVLRHDVRDGDRLARLNLATLPGGMYMLAAHSSRGERLALYKIIKAE